MDSPNPQINDTLSLISSADSIWETNETIIQTQITKDEWDQIRHDNTGDFEEDIKKDESKIIDEVLIKPSKIKVEIKKLPSDALAFYRPFHYHPYEEWGIYFVLSKYLEYMKQIMKPLYSKYKMFRSEIIATLVLYEVFHHEYYHHLVESTAFTLETILAEFGFHKNIYLQYNKEKRTKSAKKYGPHVPLEEALANAYAYNSISFARRNKLSFDTGVMKAFQSVLKGHWEIEPPGYCDAENYIDERRIEGNISLLKLMMGAEIRSNIDAIERIVARVMPSGYTSMVPKPDIPVYFLGDNEAFKRFTEFIPNPKAAYAYLEFPFTTDIISAKIKIEKELKTLYGTINEKTYAKAKPHFETVFQSFVESGKSLKDFIRWAADNFGANIKPYLLRWAKDKKAEGLAKSEKAPTIKEDELLAELDTQVEQQTKEAEPPPERPTARAKAKETAQHLKNAADKLKQINDILGQKGAVSFDKINEDKWK
jgi:hypothetical protein